MGEVSWKSKDMWEEIIALGITKVNVTNLNSNFLYSWQLITFYFFYFTVTKTVVNFSYCITPLLISCHWCLYIKTMRCTINTNISTCLLQIKRKLLDIFDVFRNFPFWMCSSTWTVILHPSVGLFVVVHSWRIPNLLLHMWSLHHDYAFRQNQLEQPLHWPHTGACSVLMFTKLRI